MLFDLTRVSGQRVDQVDELQLAGRHWVRSTDVFIALGGAVVGGTIGAVSVFKAVYIDKRELKCACVGGDSNVPLGFLSLTENLMMIAMAVWMVLGALGRLPAWAHAM